MKVIIISDSHGNISNLKYVIGFAKKIKAGAIIHCGDWDNLNAVEEVLQSRIPVYGVLGNADINERIAGRLQRVGKNFSRDYLEFKIAGKKIGVIHSFNHLSLNIKSLNILFSGHRHFKFERVVDGVKVVSPGALHSIKPSFAVYDTDTNGVEFFDL